MTSVESTAVAVTALTIVALISTGVSTRWLAISACHSVRGASGTPCRRTVRSTVAGRTPVSTTMLDCLSCTSAPTERTGSLILNERSTLERMCSTLATAVGKPVSPALSIGCPNAETRAPSTWVTVPTAVAAMSPRTSCTPTALPC